MLLMCVCIYQNVLQDIHMQYARFILKKPWYGIHTDQYHGDRQPKIELQESHTIIKSLPGCRYKSNGAGLRGHHR